MNPPDPSPDFHIENTYHWPPDGESRPWTEFWVTTFSRPVGATKEVRLYVSTDGKKTWTITDMNPSCIVGDQEVWQAPLGSFPAGTVIHYAVEGKSKTDGTCREPEFDQHIQAVIGTEQDQSG